MTTSQTGTNTTRCPSARSLDAVNQALKSTPASQQCDVLIIGAGLAGLSTALSLPSHLKVILLAKEDWTACSSYYAQGGIAAVIDKQDKVTDHVSDTLIAGDGLCDQHATTHILSQGSNAISWLLSHQVPFTTNDSITSAINSKTQELTLTDLHLTQEGGHGCRRVAHADDATGRHIMTQLYQQVLQADNITLLAFYEALQLITEGDTVRKCIGAKVINTKTHALTSFFSKAVVLASGGLGQLFSRATAPNVCVGDGIMMAWEAGCRLANLEFIQFHPTGLFYQDQNGSSNFLISEAVRGEGGLLLCPLTHERFMPSYDDRAELAPRDIVARAIANESISNGLGYVHLDISHKPAAFIKQHFPDIYAHCLSVGIDITQQPIPVAPTAHYTCGGVMTNAHGQTDVIGLYAAGEVANTGLHGANRLASNSLLECVVMGREVACHLEKILAEPEEEQHWLREHNLEIPLPHFEVPIDYPSQVSAINPLDLTCFDFTKQVSDLKQLMTHNMGIKRNQVALKRALYRVLKLKQQLPLPLDRSSLLNSKQLSSDQLNLYRWPRLLTLASLLLQSALSRKESRGGHYREDHPNLMKAASMSIIAPLSSCLSPVSPKKEAMFDNLDIDPPALVVKAS